MSTRYHVPVLLDEVLRFLPADPGGVCVDGTLGGGGHARELAALLGPKGRLIGVDQDPEALAAAAGLEADHPGQVSLLRGNFGDLPQLLRGHGVERVHGVLVDLGVSSHQLDAAHRGFSFLRDGPLDMRMDPDRGVSAAQLIALTSEEDLARVIREYGEEPRARRVARAIKKTLTATEVRSTGQLADLVEKALGRRGPKHPATRTFQALRIAVNQELEALERLLDSLPQLLAPGGRAVVIAYHSLEDRMVKRRFRSWEPHCRCPPRAPLCTCGCPGFAKVLTRSTVKPGRTEIEANPRARSARLRAVEICDTPPAVMEDRNEH